MLHVHQLQRPTLIEAVFSDRRLELPQDGLLSINRRGWLLDDAVCKRQTRNDGFGAPRDEKRNVVETMPASESMRLMDDARIGFGQSVAFRTVCLGIRVICPADDGDFRAK